MTDPTAAPAGTADELDAAQRREWNTYVARVPIDFYGQRAANTGDPVPASAVDGPDAWIPREYVDEAGTAFEGSPTVVSPEPPTVDPVTVAAPPASTPDATTITTTEG